MTALEMLNELRRVVSALAVQELETGRVQGTREKAKAEARNQVLSTVLERHSWALEASEADGVRHCPWIARPSRVIWGGGSDNGRSVKDLWCSISYG